MKTETLVKNLLQHERILKGMITAMVGNATVAEDLFQETAVVMTRKCADVPADCNFVAWGRTIALNMVRDYRKKSRRQRVSFLDDKVLESIAKTFEKTDKSVWDSRREALEECSQSLSKQHRKLLHLRYEKEVPVNKLAVMFAKTRGALDTVLYRLRKSLLKCVEVKLQQWEAS